MGWEVRKGQRYYYRTHWVNGRNQKEYVGTGEAAELAAKLDAEAAEQREILRAECRRTLEEIHEFEALLDEIDREVHDYVSAAMTAAGFHRHRGEWRRKTVASPDTSAPIPTPTPDASAPPATPPASAIEFFPVQLLPRNELVTRARNGDAKAMAVLKPMFKEPGVADAYCGDVALRALNAGVRLLAGKDLVVQEATKCKLDELRNQLAGPNPSMAELMLVERVIATWFHLHRLERDAALEGEDNTKRAVNYQRSMTLAQNRYFAAIRELARVRRAVLPPMQVNIAHEQVNVLNVPKE